MSLFLSSLPSLGFEFLWMADWPKSSTPVLVEITKGSQVNVRDRLLVDRRLLQHADDAPLSIEHPPELPDLGLMIFLGQAHDLMDFIIDFFLGFSPIVALMASA